MGWSDKVVENRGKKDDVEGRIICVVVILTALCAGVIFSLMV